MAGKSQPSAKLTLPLPADASHGLAWMWLCLSGARLDCWRPARQASATQSPIDPATRRPGDQATRGVGHALEAIHLLAPSP